ncbi:MAG: polysaccharide biosynthesis C-terminal domain-containing protein, partial [Thermoplasmata archaeon]
ILAFICFPVSLMSNYLSNILQGLKRFLIYNIIGILQSIVTFIFILLLVAIFKVGLLGAILGYLFTAIITLIILILFFYLESGRFILKWNLSVIHKTLSYGMKGHIGNVLQYLNYRFDMFLVNYFLGAASVGIYSISVAVAELIWYFPNSVGFVIFPKAASTKPEIMNNFTPRVFRITLGINTLGAMGLILLGKTLIAFVYSPAFLPAYIPMITILPGVVLLGSAKVLTNEIAGRGYPHYNSINSGFSLVLTVILDIILIPKYHIIGAALASSISYSISFILAIGFYKIVSRKGKEIIEPKIINEGINVSTPNYKI